MTARFTAGAVLAALLLAGSASAWPALKSGPQVGDANNRSGFKPQFITGPTAGKPVCPVWNNKFDLVALIFVRETSDSLTGLVKKIDQRLAAMTAKPQRAMGVYVIFDSNVNGLDGRLRTIAEKEALQKVSLCIGPPPGDYGVAGEADITVVIYNPGRRGEQNVQANFALRKADLTEAKVDAIVKAISNVLPK